MKLNSLSFEELNHWSLLRAIEWSKWPLFLSQSIAPLLFLFWSWYFVLAGVFAMNLLWAAVRMRFIIISLLNLGVYIALTKWLVCPLVAVYFFSKGLYIPGIIGLLWPLLMFPLSLVIIGVLKLPPPAPFGTIQIIILQKIKYIE